MFDTSSGVWLDRNGPGTSNRGSNGQYLNQLMRCRHAAASVGGRIYVHGGLGGPGAGNPEICKLLTPKEIIFAYLSS